MSMEAVLLTGGRSSRMGMPKAEVLVGGVPLGMRIAGQLRLVCGEVTILGRERIAGFGCLEDSGVYDGPLVALSRFVPRAEWIFVASCDLAIFDERVCELFRAKAKAGTDAVVPNVGGGRQPLCALYRCRAFDVAAKLVAQGGRSMMAWLDELSVGELADEDFIIAGIEPRSVLGANTQGELRSLLGDSSTNPEVNR